jgi:hypothetical protein
MRAVLEGANNVKDEGRTHRPIVTSQTRGGAQLIRHSLRVLLVPLLAVVATFATVLPIADHHLVAFGTKPAAASPFRMFPEIRQGARWDHMDIVFSRQQTREIARGIVGTAMVCGGIAAAGAAAGKKLGGPKVAVVTGFAGGALCVATVVPAAARAASSGRGLGITVAPAWHVIRAWTWQH